MQHAAATPDIEQPYRELGLKDDEYARIREILGRRPTAAELAMYSVMWSEHCSYKSSKVHLAYFGETTTDEMRSKMLAGIGENAGVVDIGDGWAVTFKIESHNHPSFVEPYQGAATGVGGIVRDILAMGARPVAVMDQLRFGPADAADSQRVVPGVVAGVSGYGNSPGPAEHRRRGDLRPVLRREPAGQRGLHRGAAQRRTCTPRTPPAPATRSSCTAPGPGWTASAGSPCSPPPPSPATTATAGRPPEAAVVQVGDPFAEKVLIECTLEVFHAGLVVGIQDLGGAGLSCATSELASAGDGGMHIVLDAVPLRAEGMTPAEILSSESQERMCAVVTPDKVDAFLAVCAKWEVQADVIGEVTDARPADHRIPGRDRAGRPAALGGPRRPGLPPPGRPAGLAGRVAGQHLRVAAAARQPAELGELILRMIASPEPVLPGLGDRPVRPVRPRQHRARPARRRRHHPGRRIRKRGPERGLAMATDCNGRYTMLDPYAGGQLALAEAYRNVVTTGAAPLAVTDCLNFGSPEDPARDVAVRAGHPRHRRRLRAARDPGHRRQCQPLQPDRPG